MSELNWDMISLADVHMAAAAYFNIEFADMHGDHVPPHVNRARHVAALIASARYAVVESARLLGVTVRDSRCRLNTPVSKLRALARHDEPTRRDIANVLSLLDAHTRTRRRVARFGEHFYKNTTTGRWDALCGLQGDIENGECRTCAERRGNESGPGGARAGEAGGPLVQAGNLKP